MYRITKVLYKMSRQERDAKLKYLLNEYISDRAEAQTHNETKYTRNRYTQLEVECRFGTRGNRITRNDYRQLVERLKSLGWTLHQEQYYLRVTPEYVDPATGRTKTSNLRAEITGVHNIQAYCKSNQLDVGKTVFVQKANVREGDSFLSVEYPDFGFRVAMATERTVAPNSRAIQATVQTWNDKKKLFRLLHRVSFTHPQSVVQIDLSIVRTSTFQNRRPMYTYTVQESNVMHNPEMVELECEIDADKLAPLYSMQDRTDILMRTFKQSIKHCLSAIQNTNYPISVEEQEKVLSEYGALLGKGERDRIRNKDFCGPSSISLERKHIVSPQENQEFPTIRDSYSVTDKADGQRKLLFITKELRIYLIDTNMRVEFTGVKASNPKMANTLLDGEHVLHNKQHDFINLYASFDIYFNQGRDLRGLAFMETESAKTKLYRYTLLTGLIRAMKAKGVNEDKSPMRIEHKKFYASSGMSKTIFKHCTTILEAIERNEYEYETDGLIFTPMNKGVGMDGVNEKPSNTKRTWTRSFKWKPPEFNTIDFLMTFQKKDGHEVLGSVFEQNKVSQYKATTLHVGFNESVHGKQDPCQQIIEDELPKRRGSKPEYGSEASEYKAVPFIPSDPYDPHASKCNMMIVQQGDQQVLVSEEGDIIEDNTIIECRYDPQKPIGWRWIPLRVRHDKTAELRRGGKNYGNAYHVAESVWRSIHYPVTDAMIRTGKTPTVFTHAQTPEEEFRKYVRESLARLVPKGSSIYLANTGHGEDFPMWIDKEISFLLGTDIQREPLFHRLHGSCAKYLELFTQYSSVPSALFAHADLSRPWNESFFSDKGRQISQAIFGKGSKDRRLLGNGVYKHYGVVEDGFQTVFHHQVDSFFESKDTLYTFVRNMAHVCKVGGYFAGCMLDGREVFDELSDVKQDGSKGTTWRMVKKYDVDTFEEDETSLGLEYHIHHGDHVRKTYLASMVYFMQVMEQEGFVLVSKSIAKEHKIKQTALYKSMHKQLMKERKQDESLYPLVAEMDDETKEFMFYHRYFVFMRTQAQSTQSTPSGKVSIPIVRPTKTEKATKTKKRDKADSDDEPDPSLSGAVIPDSPDKTTDKTTKTQRKSRTKPKKPKTSDKSSDKTEKSKTRKSRTTRKE